MRQNLRDTFRDMTPDENREALVGREFVHFKGGHYRFELMEAGS